MAAKLPKMVTVWNKLWWGGDPDQLDDVTGLSKRDVHRITKSWAVMNAEPDKYGMQLFLRLFRLNPATQDFFKMIQHKKEEEIANSFQFKAHVINLMSAVNSAVVNLNQPEVVIALLHKLGESHHRRGIQRIHFEELKIVLEGVLKNDLNQDEATIGSWVRFVNFIYKPIYETVL